MSLTVKAYYERGEGEPEIRRFAVDAGVSSSYQYLISKIQQVFGAQVTRETVDLFWKGKNPLTMRQPLVTELSCRFIYDNVTSFLFMNIVSFSLCL